MSALILVHGWGFGPGVWRPVRAALATFSAEVSEVKAWDLGFFGQIREPLPPNGSFVAVGHSLGLLHLLQRLAEDSPKGEELRRRCVALVAINGFSRFSLCEGYPGVPERVLLRMQRRLRRDPAG
ncbi:MAG: hypothetical protein HQL50_16350, partial [Magnetococcales bacterium]|nr:hypothetical protein [Magnetococcales bacterium]